MGSSRLYNGPICALYKWNRSNMPQQSEGSIANRPSRISAPSRPTPIRIQNKRMSDPHCNRFPVRQIPCLNRYSTVPAGRSDSKSAIPVMPPRPESTIRPNCNHMIFMTRSDVLPTEPFPYPYRKVAVVYASDSKLTSVVISPSPKAAIWFDQRRNSCSSINLNGRIRYSYDRSCSKPTRNSQAYIKSERKPPITRYNQAEPHEKKKTSRVHNIPPNISLLSYQSQSTGKVCDTLV